MSTTTPEQVLESIVTGINSGDLDSLMPLYESEAAFATEPGSLAHRAPGIGVGRVELDLLSLCEPRRVPLARFHRRVDDIAYHALERALHSVVG